MTYDAGSRGAIGYLEAAREMAFRAVNPPQPAPVGAPDVSPTHIEEDKESQA